jgi:hypothetical protein
MGAQALSWYIRRCLDSLGECLGRLFGAMSSDLIWLEKL